MDKKLQIRSPLDDAPHPGPAVTLLDEQTYPARIFGRDENRLEAGEGIESIDGTAFRLAPDLHSKLIQEGIGNPAIALFVSSDTHVKTFVPLLDHCARVTFIVPQRHDFGERDALRRLGIQFHELASNTQALEGVQVALLANDWGTEERLFIHQCRRRGILTAVLQESTNVDFGGYPHRMEWADVAFLQGPHTLNYRARRHSFCTGNPRYDTIQSKPLPDDPSVLINCNFTFGQGESWAREWVEAAVNAAEAAGLPYSISVHPRDTTNLTGLGPVEPSGPERVGDHIRNASIVVSRDSALPYEALLWNRHAVYFAPVFEKECTLREDSSGLIHKCDSQDALQSCLQSIQANAVSADIDNSGHQHLFTAIDGANAQRVARALGILAANPQRYRENDARREAYPVIRARVWSQYSARPALRRVPGLQAVWRLGKRVVQRS